MTCSIPILNKELRSKSSDLLSKVFDNNSMGFAWFRICSNHSHENWLESFTLGNSEQLEKIRKYKEKVNTEEEARTWCDRLPCESHWRGQAALSPSRHETVCQSIKATKFSDSFSQGSFEKKLLEDKNFELGAVRKPFKAPLNGNLISEPYRLYMNRLYEVYERSFTVSQLTDVQWSAVENINAALLKALGFHREGEQQALVTSCRIQRTKKRKSKKLNKDQKFHFDHKAFGADYIVGIDLDGSYNLAFIMNPADVLLGKQPQFNALRLEKDDVYILTGPFLDIYPHCPVPRKDQTNLDRRVLLIGGILVSPSDEDTLREVPCMHEESKQTPIFYHFAAEPAVPNEFWQNCFYDDKFLEHMGKTTLQHIIPETAISGTAYSECSDSAPSDKVNSSTNVNNSTTHYYYY